MSQGIANVFINGANLTSPTPVTVTFGNVITGTGTITINGNLISGQSTIFKSQIDENYVIRNNNNEYVGRIANVVSDSSAILIKPATVAMSNAIWKYQSQIQTPILYDPFNFAKLVENPEIITVSLSDKL